MIDYKNDAIFDDNIKDYNEKLSLYEQELMEVNIYEY